MNKTRHTQPIKTSQIDGDVAVGRNVNMGGNAIVQGNTLLKGNTIVEGWLIAANVVSSHKGYFKKKAELEAKYPVPEDGWWSFVGDTLYVVSDGEWKIVSGEVGQGSIEVMKKLFLSKLNPDVAHGLITFMQGLQVGEFASGLTGFGAKIDKHGYGEMRGLRLWEWLEVPELRYNRVEAVAGIGWRSPGVGIIAYCQPDRSAEGEELDTGICRLKLEDGERGGVARDDIALGIYHFGDERDAAADEDDSKGNFAVKGFGTTYFRITGVSGADGNTFTYSLRPGCTVHPQAQMHFVCYGNFTDETRQSSVYETRTYTRMLWKQNTWEMGKKNIALQMGELENLNVHGLNMEGYSMYINSVYFTGTVTQVKPDGTPVRVANDRGAWQAGRYDYYDRVSHNGCLWLCVNEKGTQSEPTEGNADWLLQVDKGAEGSAPVMLAITSSKGVLFQGGVQETILTATAWRDNVDITEKIPPSRFSWTRSSANTADDRLWNSTHQNVGRSITIDADDVNRSAVFGCDVELAGLDLET